MIFEKITDMLSEKTGVDKSEITGETIFAEMGLDSLDIAEMLLGIEEAFGVSIQAGPDIISVSDLVNKVETALAEKQ
ncbi:MAG: acyl carrier protein [Clostridiales bacterium]|jgi:acyl carrier protein|nr:acyl carrier protein [Clostridiales bacterium]